MMTAEQNLLLDLSEPDQGVLTTMGKIPQDLLLLGAGGKIGHGLALMAKRAFNQIGHKGRVLAVSRFSSAKARQELEADGITTVACDLGDANAVRELPDASHVVYLAGQKFGTGDNASITWLLNTYVPGVVAQRWSKSRIAVYSSGNVYPFTPVTSGGPTEKEAPAPIGEYAQSVLGRERIFEYFSRHNGTPITTIRLNYANEPRYGVLVDLANTILAGKEVDLTQGQVNIVWQGDCNRVTLCSLDLAASPPAILNLAGPQVSVRELATKLAQALGVAVRFTGQEAANALLSNSSHCWKTFGPPKVGVDEMIQRVAAWLKSGGATMGKPTHFEARDGKF